MLCVSDAAPVFQRAFSAWPTCQGHASDACVQLPERAELEAASESEKPHSRNCEGAQAA